jgi:DNA-binding response OmpR family regulator
VEKLGGGIVVDTAVDRGTTFSIYLPYRTVAAGVSDGGDRSGRVRSILFVDDDADIRHIGKRILEKQGYRVFVAENGEGAFQYLEHHDTPDLLIVDFHMPGIEGKSFIEQLTETGNTPILLITGEITEELDTVSGIAGIVDVVRKPLDIERFLKTVEVAVQK